jgi:hypothetical protein
MFCSCCSLLRRLNTNSKPCKKQSNHNPELNVIWCHLFDNATGEPYNRTEPTMVHVSSNAVLYDFQEAVNAKFSDRYLEHFPPSALHVYTTKAAFDKRNDDDATPLTPEKFLSKPILGESMEKALIVAIPTQEFHAPVEVKDYDQQCLDAIASRLCHFYKFRRINIMPTISDVLEAKNGKEGDDWKIHQALTDYEQILDDGYTRTYRRGDPLISIKLPDVYTTEEWEKLEMYNSKNVVDAPVTSISEMIAFLDGCKKKAYQIPNRDVAENEVHEDVLTT